MVDGVGGRPDDVVMAVLAHVGCRDMRRVLAGGRNAVMAAGAVAGDVGVVKVCGQPCSRGVAVVAVVAAGNMCRVLAGCRYSVVASGAWADDLRMIDRERRNPAGCSVAVLAEIRCLDVVGMLAGRVEAIVAAGTTAGDPGVIEYDGDPGGSGVAVVALFARWRMTRRPARGRDAIVATAATASYGRMIHVGNRAPCRRGVAVGTDLRRRDVIDRPG